MLKTILTFLTGHLNFLTEYVGPMALTVALIAIGPLFVLFLGEKDFKRSNFMLIKSIVAMTLSLLGAYVMFTNAAINHEDVISRYLYVATALVSIFSTCGIIILRANYTKAAFKNDYDFLAFFISYHLHWAKTSVQNQLPEKATVQNTVHRVRKVFSMDRSTRNELVFENKMDSTSDLVSKNKPEEKNKEVVGKVLELQHE